MPRSTRHHSPPAPYFRINNQDWLEYTPFKKHELPKLVHVLDEDGNEEVRSLLRPTSKKLVREGHLYRLAWPGETNHEVEIPFELVKNWSTYSKGFYLKAPCWLGEIGRAHV